MKREVDAAPGQRAEWLALARAIAEMPRLLKGYGETHRRGRRSFDAILHDLVDDPVSDDRVSDGRFDAPGERADRIGRALKAALAEPQGHELARVLGRPLPPLREQPIRIVRRKAG